MTKIVCDDYDCKSNSHNNRNYDDLGETICLKEELILSTCEGLDKK